MNKPIPIENLSANEKIELMEKLWLDLSSSPYYSPPEWYGEEHARRKNAVEEGEETYTDWYKANEEIQYELARKPPSLGLQNAGSIKYVFKSANSVNLKEIL